MPRRCPDALAIAATAPAERIARRLNAALRMRTLHGTVLRRMEHARRARRGAARTAGRRSARRSDRPGRRPRPLLSGARGRRRRARRPGRRAQRRKRCARAQRPRHRWHGDRRRLRPAHRRSAAHGARRGRALSRSAGRRARRPSRLIEGFCRASAQSRPHRRRPGAARRTLSAVRARCMPSAQRLKRMLKSLDAKGMIDPDTGLLAHDGILARPQPRGGRRGKARRRAVDRALLVRRAATAASGSTPRGSSAG